MIFSDSIMPNPMHVSIKLKTHTNESIVISIPPFISIFLISITDKIKVNIFRKREPTAYRLGQHPYVYIIITSKECQVSIIINLKK